MSLAVQIINITVVILKVLSEQKQSEQYINFPFIILVGHMCANFLGKITF